MIKKILEFIKFKKEEVPEINYIDYEDAYIKEINNVKLKEETDNELLEKVS